MLKSLLMVKWSSRTSVPLMVRICLGSTPVGFINDVSHSDFGSERITIHG